MLGNGDLCVRAEPVTVLDMDGVDVETCSGGERDQRCRIGSARQCAGDRGRGWGEGAASEELTDQLVGIDTQRSWRRACLPFGYFFDSTLIR